VRVGEGGADGGGDRGGIRWSSGCSGGKDQPVDRPKNTGDTVSHHGVSVPGVTVNGDRVVHRRLRGHVIGIELYSILGWPNLHDSRLINRMTRYKGNRITR
jgi:hypothetical protein